MEIETDESLLAPIPGFLASTPFPRIVAFACSWCCYDPRETGTGDFLLVRTMCSGRMQPALMLEALRLGADGVLLAACRAGECHYRDGNSHLERRGRMLKKLLSRIELGAERLRLEWLSAPEAEKLRRSAGEFRAELQKLGPSPLDPASVQPSAGEKARGALQATMSFRLRAMVAKLHTLATRGNVYGEKLTEEALEELLEETVEEELVRGRILSLLAGGPRTVKEIAKATGLPPDVVFANMARLWRSQVVCLCGHDGPSPKYAIMEVRA
jgi:coenzyme F420-reducing hydrogenase delta subunit/DNA-binding transcriptional ArsR family regulator